MLISVQKSVLELVRVLFNNVFICENTCTSILLSIHVAATLIRAPNRSLCTPHQHATYAYTMYRAPDEGLCTPQRHATYAYAMYWYTVGYSTRDRSRHWIIHTHWRRGGLARPSRRAALSNTSLAMCTVAPEKTLFSFIRSGVNTSGCSTPRCGIWRKLRAMDTPSGPAWLSTWRQGHCEQAIEPTSEHELPVPGGAG